MLSESLDRLEQSWLGKLEPDAPVLRSSLTVDGNEVAIGSAVGEKMEYFVVPSHGSEAPAPGDDCEHRVGALRPAFCIGVADGLSLQVEAQGLGTKNAPVVAKHLAYALSNSDEKLGTYTPAWGAMVREREDFGALAFLPSTWVVSKPAEGSADFLAGADAGSPQIIVTYYCQRLTTSGQRYQRLKELKAPDVIIENEKKLLSNLWKEVQARGALQKKVLSGLSANAQASLDEVLLSLQ